MCRRIAFPKHTHPDVSSPVEYHGPVMPAVKSCIHEDRLVTCLPGVQFSDQTARRLQMRALPPTMASTCIIF